MTLDSNIAAGDHVVIKFPRDRFTFLMTATSSLGRVVVIDHWPNNKIYYFIMASTNLLMNAAGSTIYLYNIRNANDYTPGVILELVFWASMRKIAYVTFPVSPVW